MKYVLLFALVVLFACAQENSQSGKVNPAAPGFNELNSDQRAIELADLVMLANGGRKAWDQTKFLKWNFFGSRRHVWNKETGDVVINGIRDTFLITLNINDMSGSVNYKGEEITQPDSLTKYLQMGKEMWINDSYWVFLPYKLKDSGVTLKHLESLPGNDSLAARELVELKFDSVGVTPQNKYVLTIDMDSQRISQWDFYPQSTDSIPRFSTPWTNYQEYGDIMLSSGRGKYEISEIAVGDSLAIYFK